MHVPVYCIQMSRVTEKGPLGYFYPNVYFSILWMNITLWLVCANFSGIAVKISFLLGLNMAYTCKAVSFLANMTSWCYVATSNFFLYMNNIFIAQWLFVGNSEILHCSHVLHVTRNFVNQKTFSSKHVSTFLPQKYDGILNHVTATLRAFFAWRGLNDWILDVYVHVYLHNLLVHWKWHNATKPLYTYSITFNSIGPLANHAVLPIVYYNVIILLSIFLSLKVIG